jgi:hypothetical protein
MRILLAVALLTLCGCAIQAEKERPEDVAGIRISRTTISAIQSWIMGGSEICQLTLLFTKSDTMSDEEKTLLESYLASVDEDGCSINNKKAPE